jgi:hypothetical protein
LRGSDGLFWTYPGTSEHDNKAGSADERPPIMLVPDRCRDIFDIDDPYYLELYNAKYIKIYPLFARQWT